MKTFKILLFYFLFIIYSLEILLFFFVTENNLSKEQIFNKRIEIAKKKGIKYDSRSREEAFLDFRKVASSILLEFDLKINCSLFWVEK